MIRFELRPHSLRPGQTIVEVFEDSTLIATITAPADGAGAGVRVFSKYLTHDRPPSYEISLVTSTDNRPIGLVEIPLAVPPPGARRPGYN